jgi:hypothetical protein
MSILPPTNPAPIQQQPALNFATLVKSWIHYDNLASSFYKQTLNARKVRSEYEAQIQENLHKQKMENAIIQVNGGKIGIVEERQPAPLTMLKLEDLLHTYFHSSKQTDQTREILEFVRENRGTTSSKRLRYQ